MKFLCVECDRRMSFAERKVPGDGTLAAVFECDRCGRAVAMLTNPMETQLVSSLGVEIGGRQVPERPMELSRGQMAGPGPDPSEETGREPSAGDADVSGPARKPEAGGREGAGGARRREERPGSGPGDPSVAWTDDAVERLGRVPSFVRGMVRRIYTDYAREQGLSEVTPEVMDRARSDLGLEGM